MLGELTQVIEALPKANGWALNRRRDRLKRRIWRLPASAADPVGLTIEGIHNEFIGDIQADAPMTAVFGQAPRQRWLEVRHRWRTLTRLPSIGQIEDALYEMVKEGAVEMLGARFRRRSSAR